VRILLNLAGCLRSRLGVCLRNDGPSLIKRLCCSRICMYPNPSWDSGNGDYFRKDTHDSLTNNWTMQTHEAAFRHMKKFQLLELVKVKKYQP